MIDWCQVPDRTLRDPFFDQTIWRRIHEEGAGRKVTPVSELTTGRAGAGRFGGFIFHGSRCGSTLVAQMLAAVPRFSVLSEPQILDTAPDLQGEFLDVALRWAAEDARTLFVKFSARAIAGGMTLPPAPSLFLYRDPLEVVAAFAAIGDQLPRGVWGLLDNSPDTVAEMRPAEFWARVAGRQYGAAAARDDLRLVNYQQLLEDAALCVKNVLDLDLSESELQSMRGVTARNAKRPHLPFTKDREAKRSVITDEVRDAVARWALEPYERLEALRRAQG